MILNPWVRDINSAEQVVKAQEGRQRAKGKHGEANLYSLFFCFVLPAKKRASNILEVLWFFFCFFGKVELTN